MCLLSTVLDRDFSRELYFNQRMKRALIILSLFETLLCGTAYAQDFSFHLQTEPHSADPAELTSVDAAFFFPQIFRGLYRYENERGLVPEGATQCSWTTPLKLKCTLNTQVKWSDGSKVTAADYVRGWQHLLRPQSRSPAVELLTNVKNANEIFSGKLQQDTLAVRAVNDRELEIEFSKADPDFLFKLTSPVLVPVKVLPFPDRAAIATLVVNGPYRVSSWLSGNRLRLEKNTHYPFGNPNRPNVEIYFIPDDETALTLYRAGRLKFLRRLPTHELKAWQGKRDLFQTPVARFDYLGFGPQFPDNIELRKALALAIDYEKLKKLLSALGRPGCPSIADSYMSEVPCHTLDLKSARAALAKVPRELLAKPLRVGFSALGGDDIKRSIEFIADQWTQNLGLKVNIEQTENGVFSENLRKFVYPIFRKGVALDRPTCLAALETFASDSPENFLQLNSSEYDANLAKLGAAKSPAETKKLCSHGVKLLVEHYRLIPLGRIHFTYLIRPEFVGWKLNEMNQLDLANLKFLSNNKL
jgi:oligopeptide transport system substrate-binding protein